MNAAAGQQQDVAYTATFAHHHHHNLQHNHHPYMATPPYPQAGVGVAISAAASQHQQQQLHHHQLAVGISDPGGFSQQYSHHQQPYHYHTPNFDTVPYLPNPAVGFGFPVAVAQGGEMHDPSWNPGTGAVEQATVLPAAGVGPPPAAATGATTTADVAAETAAADPTPLANEGGSNTNTATSKRLCAFPGCGRVVKSQGHCQRHGAITKRCKVPGCDKQAQGTHQGMCKRHYKEITGGASQSGENSSKSPSSPSGPQQEPGYPEKESGIHRNRTRSAVASVYEAIIPSSIAWHPSRPNSIGGKGSRHQRRRKAQSDADVGGTRAGAEEEEGQGRDHANSSPGLGGSNRNSAPAKNGGGSAATFTMPLVQHLRSGRAKPLGWHRSEERRACGVGAIPVKSQLEPWEKQLALVEILLLSGGTPGADFRDLAHAWGREKGFHHVLTGTLCERRGEVTRKVRSDRRRLLGSTKDASVARGGGGGQPSSDPRTVAAKRRRVAPTQSPPADPAHPSAEAARPASPSSLADEPLPNESDRSPEGADGTSASLSSLAEEPACVGLPPEGPPPV